MLSGAWKSWLVKIIEPREDTTFAFRADYQWRNRGAQQLTEVLRYKYAP